MVPTDELALRPITPDDLPGIAELHIRVRAAAYPAMTPRSLDHRNAASAFRARSGGRSDRRT